MSQMPNCRGGETGGMGTGEAPREIGPNLKQFPVILMFHDAGDWTGEKLDSNAIECSSSLMD